MAAAIRNCLSLRWGISVSNRSLKSALSSTHPLSMDTLTCSSYFAAPPYGQSLLQQMPPDSEFFRRVHRFYCDSFEDVCELCKELHRIVCEPIDIGLLNSKIDPANAEASNKQGLRQ